MKKIMLSILLFFGISTLVKAQFLIGLEAGYNKNHLNSSTAYRSFIQYKPLESFNIGIPVKYKFNQWFAVQSDPQFIRKSYRYERTGFYTGIYQDNKNNYLKLPLMAQFSFGNNKIKGFLNLGGYAAYWSSGNVKGLQLNMFGESLTPNSDNLEPVILDGFPGATYNESYSFDKRRDRRLDLGLLLGIGINYKLKTKFEIFAETRYYRSMLDMQKNYMKDQVNRYNDTYVLQIGCLYQLGK